MQQDLALAHPGLHFMQSWTGWGRAGKVITEGASASEFLTMIGQSETGIGEGAGKSK